MRKLSFKAVESWSYKTMKLFWATQLRIVLCTFVPCCFLCSNYCRLKMKWLKKNLIQRDRTTHVKRSLQCADDPRMALPPKMELPRSPNTAPAQKVYLIFTLRIFLFWSCFFRRFSAPLFFWAVLFFSLLFRVFTFWICHFLSSTYSSLSFSNLSVSFHIVMFHGIYA